MEEVVAHKKKTLVERAYGLVPSSDAPWNQPEKMLRIGKRARKLQEGELPTVDLMEARVANENIELVCPDDPQPKLRKKTEFDEEDETPLDVLTAKVKELQPARLMLGTHEALHRGSNNFVFMYESQLNKPACSVPGFGATVTALPDFDKTLAKDHCKLVVDGVMPCGPATMYRHPCPAPWDLKPIHRDEF